jgi:hypothetical protein
MKKKLFIAVLNIILIMSAVILYTSCKTETAEPTIINVYQPLGSGMVHTWIEVKFDDNSTDNIVLPDNDEVWSKARTMNGKKVKLRKQSGKWQFVDFSE